jgi:cell wall-associated NlpC family hydrolase
MLEKIQELIRDLAQKRADGRLNIFAIEIESLLEDQLKLSGRVLEQDDLKSLVQALGQQYPNLLVDAGAVEVLRKPSNPLLTVATNLTSTHTSTSFVAEMSSQMVYGEKVEILVEQGNWVYTRQMDGYLAWTYKPYLSAAQIPDPTHIVMAPVAELYAQPDPAAPVLTRVLSGARILLLSTLGEWAQVSANMTGWMKMADLRALADFPTSNAARRGQMLIDAQRMIGVPYLWGGAAGNGIDCSGFARLLHRWVGLEIPRDADMQSAQCQRVEPPYQPGDLFFFGEGDGNRRITHVGVSLGGWKVIHSSRSRNGVYLDDVQEKDTLRAIFAHAGTFLND